MMGMGKPSGDRNLIGAGGQNNTAFMQRWGPGSAHDLAGANLAGMGVPSYTPSGAPSGGGESNTAFMQRWGPGSAHDLAGANLAGAGVPSYTPPGGGGGWDIPGMVGQGSSILGSFPNYAATSPGQVQSTGMGGVPGMYPGMTMHPMYNPYIAGGIPQGFGGAAPTAFQPPAPPPPPEPEPAAAGAPKPAGASSAKGDLYGYHNGQSIYASEGK